MKTFRLAAAFLALILWIPTLFGVSYGGMLWSALTGLAGSGAPEIAAVPEPAAPEPPPAPAEPPPKPTPPREAALLDTAALGPARTVTVVDTVPFEAFLAAGEAAPDPAYRDLYAEARAGALAEAECPRLIASLATACLPLGVTAEPTGDGRYRVTLRLAFAPADRVRELREDEAFERATEATLLDVPAARGVAQEALGAAHESIYRAARFACFIARARRVACTVAEVRVETAASAETPGTYDVTGEVRLAISRTAEGG
ncbi:MAG: hypothetical protein OEM24_02280 [Paracoccaceae bacterium]|nr:hypothetical protein [Paracoccaceae bacterium]